jgi:SAM-dependent methyltransferase
MNNYEYCADWVEKRQSTDSLKVLDYGCGAGIIVGLLRAKGIDAYGCDVFYEGGDYSTDVDNHLFAEGSIRRMENDTIPFEDQSFDLIVNNQVLEHVSDLDMVLVEMNRVLKPGGTILSLFPDKSVWREGHCGIPFLHWFRKGTTPRIYYAYALRSLGMGYHHGSKSKWQWSSDFCEWLDNWTHYRNLGTITKAFENRVGPCTHIEDRFFQARLDQGNPMRSMIPAWVQKIAVRKLACLVFESRKPAPGGHLRTVARQ